MGVGAYTEMGTYSGQYGKSMTLFFLFSHFFFSLFFLFFFFFFLSLLMARLSLSAETFLQEPWLLVAVRLRWHCHLLLHYCVSDAP